ncbi:hypothetical protein [Noviherbaspirillum massiliense]|uniref:hypothetical protein n=1 Tax=Noviherbaspirillum massiliense TaxID=1465823 RepID=UPI0002D7846B|nr:hypothetical protein [Noviherbaspirillum massiliense]
MDLTRDFVKSKRPCSSGLRWFLRNYEKGSDYQPLLDALVSAGRVDDACWLLTQFGPTDAVLSVDSIDVDAIVFAGTLEVRGSIEADSIVRAGRTIQADGAIRCGKNLRAGGSITSLDCICAGNGIEAGATILSHRHLEANWGIRAGKSIIAHGAIKAGESLQAEEDIRSGDGYGIYAGLDVQFDAWEASARVRARSRPERLMSGWWTGTCPA